jgi:plasmid stabilization system protein ParE
VRRLNLAPDAVLDIERLLNFRRDFAPGTEPRLHRALLQKILSLPETCEHGYRLEADIRETYMKHGRARYVFRYRVLANEVLLLRVWSGREDRN